MNRYCFYDQAFSAAMERICDEEEVYYYNPEDVIGIEIDRADSISDLQYFPNLESFHLSCAELDNVDMLLTLPRLTELIVDLSIIHDTSAIWTLSNLTNLSICMSETLDTMSVTKLRKLNELCLVSMPLSNTSHWLYFRFCSYVWFYLCNDLEFETYINSILFLDEMAEFSPRVLDLLRQPMEDNSILISRAGIKVRFPTQFLLVGATNPCRCGKLLENPKLCTCNEWQRKQYMNRISGPLLDRIDLFSELYQIDKAALLESVQGTNLHLSDCLREQVEACWERQYIRCDEAGQSRVLNGSNRTHQIMEFFRITSQSVDYAVQSSEKLRISARGLNRILRVARTIADLEGESDVLISHVSEALQFRQKT